MLSKEEVTKKLTHLGFTESEIPTVIQDVVEVIMRRTLEACIMSLPSDTRDYVIALSPTELETYLKEHASSFPQLSETEFEAIHDETWRHYFKSVA